MQIVCVCYKYRLCVCVINVDCVYVINTDCVCVLYMQTVCVCYKCRFLCPTPSLLVRIPRVGPGSVNQLPG